jgi:hypothetical protein
MILYCGLSGGELDSDDKAETRNKLKSFWGMRAAFQYLKGGGSSKWIPVRNKFGNAPGGAKAITAKVKEIVKDILEEVEKAAMEREERRKKEDRNPVRDRRRRLQDRKASS